ncbi:hypothetical protein BpHYR1_035417, partial [Brachionus plicatilis]
MEFKEEKCKAMVINNKNLSDSLSMNIRALGMTDKERDLGIVLFSNLKWNHQATLAANRTSM